MKLPSSIKLLVLACVSSVFILACKSTSEKHITNGATQAKIENIKAHMNFLAHDLLEGRDTGSRGHEIASLYIANEFERYGLKPAGENGTFMQRVGFRRAVLDKESPALYLTRQNESVELSFLEHFTLSPSLAFANAMVDAPMVFVGYGIAAPELGHNDYKNLDVKGKVVVMLTGKPKSFTSEVASHLSSGRQKTNYAANRGAIGIITIQTPAAEERRPFERSKLFVDRPRMTWVKGDTLGNRRKEIQASAFLSMQAASILFEGASDSIENVYAQLENDSIPNGFDLAYALQLSYDSVHKDITSPNVIGMLEGSDPELKNEYVIYTAHSDHLGISKSVKKDKINNGAMDNASGTSVLIETARMFSQLAVAPKRSILFAAVTGEEKGLLGADYFVRNPTKAIDSIVANVNLDMPLLTYEFADVIAFGASHSTMGKKLEKAVANAGISLSDDPWPELNLFTRSDHYAFVKQGVPAIFLVTGIKSKTPDIDGSNVLNQFLGSHYHQPSDDMSQAFVWPAAATFTEVNFEIGLTIGNDNERPRWYEDSFFGQTFGNKKHLVKEKVETLVEEVLDELEGTEKK